MSASSQVSLLRRLFGDNRAEWAAQNFDDFFVPPVYSEKLRSVRPTILVGGRGTGKTTSLQSLKYDATLHRLESQGLTFSDQEHLGVLVRMNKNRVAAFQGADTDQQVWKRAFAHYFNLLVVSELIGLAEWLEQRSEGMLGKEDIGLIGGELGLSHCDNLEILDRKVRSAISALQLFVNNPSRIDPPVFSMPESPLRVFVETMDASQLLEGRVVFCCIDEYENLLDYQQAIVNTYLKHAERPLSYKVGVRKNGLRNRQTLDGQDVLKTPDDYEEIEIAEEGFEYFATRVAELRLRYAIEHGVSVASELGGFLEELKFQEEAIKLGAERHAKEVLKEIKPDSAVFEYFQSKPPSETYFLAYWKDVSGEPIRQLARDWYESEGKWVTRIGNYGYESLFWLSKGRKGSRIKKYYCGKSVLLALPAGNIRYFLELLDTSIAIEIDDDTAFVREKPLTLSAESQTNAVIQVGRHRLDELEGLADNGVALKRLVLGIGKVFFEKARHAAGAPEITSFVIAGENSNARAFVEELLADGVGHLAFEVAPRTKPTSSLELKDNEYRLHRIFSGFFSISHRKKRRMTFNAEDLKSLVESRPSKAISALLGGGEQTAEEELPEQMALFGSFYHEN